MLLCSRDATTTHTKPTYQIIQWMMFDLDPMILTSFYEHLPFPLRPSGKRFFWFSLSCRAALTTILVVLARLGSPGSTEQWFIPHFLARDKLPPQECTSLSFSRASSPSFSFPFPLPLSQMSAPPPPTARPTSVRRTLTHSSLTPSFPVVLSSPRFLQKLSFVIATACYGSDESQFPPNNLFAAAGDAIWDNDASCGRQYLVRCLSSATPGACMDGTVQVTIVDYAPSLVSAPSAVGATMVLSETAYGMISQSANEINIEFTQYDTHHSLLFTHHIRSTESS